ncbi:GlxA family transcriptional regulator [Granulosicoccus antarcticus]|uniref:HTH-type transcriptional regulator CdhR n=1 Tax=Granulosicoccus antarcticus IMCC3135 TaxID=1192854 RepID=A0A2Z2NW25_9GAMM|nr:GlxA family transcriptional regulator [Granulosicoccus antarcticus]ASJ75656.1 HTH-type transcriptional regulator CdhR [Granulosicoccus antarcticus IMCC3135]
MDILSATIVNRPYRVGFLLLDGFSLMSYASAMEPLRACNLLSEHPLYQICNMAVKGAFARSSSDALVPATRALHNQTELDLVLVVAGGHPSSHLTPSLIHWLRQQADKGILIGGVSAGPLILARAGIMEGRRMTVHWEHAQELAEVSPKLTIERSLYVRDRDRLTCAGGSAALDMMHALITEHHGPALARQISEWFMHTDIRPGELTQRASIAERYNIVDSVVIQSIEAMENHLADPLALTQLASLAGLGGRQLNRHFHQQLGTSTIEFYRRLRLQKAQELLTSTSWSLANISVATGFANGAHLSRLFTQHYGQSPSQARLQETGKI